MEKIKNRDLHRIIVGEKIQRIFYMIDKITSKLVLAEDGKMVAELTIIFFGDIVEYHSYTEPEHRGRGLNTMLRTYFHEDLAGTGLTLQNMAYSPASDHILRKLGVPRTAHFDKFLQQPFPCQYIDRGIDRDDEDGNYEKKIDMYPLHTHEKKF
jgi:hypothetical protein